MPSPKVPANTSPFDFDAIARTSLAIRPSICSLQLCPSSVERKTPPPK
jgi:hypothetical protein